MGEILKRGSQDPMKEKSELELLYEVLEEQRKNHLANEIKLQYLKVQLIGHPNDEALARVVKQSETMAENDKIILRLIRQRIKELEK